MSLSATLTPDDHGRVPKVEVHHRRRSARTLANRRYLARLAVDLARAAGAKVVTRTNFPPLLLHVHSTMRMGTDESNSVLDPSGATRAIGNIYVADNSALANALGGPHPTLTTQALATRTAEKLFRWHFDGDPWVGREPPVSSVDDAVTKAVLARGL